MSIKVLYFAELKEIAEKDNELIEATGKKIGEIAQILSKKYRSMKLLLLDSESNDLRQNISIAINHNLMKREDINKRLLNDGDKIAFLLPLSGG